MGWYSHSSEGEAPGSGRGKTRVSFNVTYIWDTVLFPAATPPAEQEVSFVTELFRSFGEWALASGTFEDPRNAVLIALTVIALTMAVIGGLAQWGYTWFSRRASLQMIVDLRVRVARHLMGLSMRYHHQREFGDLLSRVSADVQVTLMAVHLTLRSLVLQPIMALAALSMAFIAAPWPALGMLVVLPIAVWPVLKLTAKVRKGSEKSLTSLGASVQALTQMFQGIRTVKSFGGEERELERYRGLNQGYMRAAMKMVRASAMAHAWTVFYSIAGVALMVLVLGWLAIRFNLFGNAGQMVIFFVAIARVNNHVKNYTRALTRVAESVGASQRIQALLDEPVEVVESEHPVSIRALGSGIRCENVTFRYAADQEPAIHDLTLEVRPGETLALVGPSGAGKSTLVDLIARFNDPTNGRITVDGHDLRSLALTDWTALYAAVGQVPFLFHSSIGENIAYGKEGATQAEIEAAARAADIHDFVASLSEGYATNVADMGARLSGGQRQRITIARALLKEAPLLLLDEATSALDSESEGEVQRALERLMADRTVVVIAHRLSTVRDADRIAVLDRGRLVELGAHDELIARNGQYARLYALQNLDAPRETKLSRSPTSR